MLGFPIRTLNTIKKYLLRQQREVEKNLKEVEKDDPATAPALAEASEPGTDSWIAQSHISALALLSTLRKTAGSIKKALSKIKNGSYGKCERCGKRIETSRLLVMPTTPYCVSCSQKLAKK